MFIWVAMVKVLVRFFFLQEKVKWFSCEFSREKKLVFVWICEVKRVLRIGWKGLRVVRKENEKLQRFPEQDWSRGKSLVMLSWINNVVTCKL